MLYGWLIVIPCALWQAIAYIGLKQLVKFTSTTISEPSVRISYSCHCCFVKCVYDIILTFVKLIDSSCMPLVLTDYVK